MPHILDDIVYVAEGDGKRVGLALKDRRFHQYVVGRTGVGKSTLLENMIIQDIRAGRGLAVIDPHGDLIQSIIAHIPESRIRDVIYVNPADPDYAIGFNVFRAGQRMSHARVVSQIISIFKKHWGESWGPRLEHVLRNSLLTLVEHPESTLLWLPKLLSDEHFRNKQIKRLKDPIVKSFWQHEFASYSERFRAEVLAPLQNKVGAFSTNPFIRTIVGQSRSKFNVREVMDREKILLIRIPKGEIGEDATNLLGAFFLSAIELAALSRADIPEPDRKDFFLYIDEFQSFATESFASILSEARKYRLSLILAHQYLAQVDEKTRDAVFGNVGTMILFRVGVDDARILEREVHIDATDSYNARGFDANFLINLSPFEVVYKRMVGGKIELPQSAMSLAPARHPDKNFAAEIEAFTRKQYARRRVEVEAEIGRFFTDAKQNDHYQKEKPRHVGRG